MDAPDWSLQRDLIRLLVKRVEVDHDEINVVFRVAPPPASLPPGPEGGRSWQDCWRSDGPAPQAAAQGCATGLTRGGTQAAPGRALAQKAPQCRHNPDGLARRVAGSTAWPLVAGVDDRGDKMQKPEIHCCYPCLVSQTWAAAAQHPNQINSTLSSCENRLLVLQLSLEVRRRAV